MSHTPRPWVAWSPIGECWAVSTEQVLPNGHKALHLRVADEIDNEADATLISAAPDLLEALVMVRDADDDCRLDGLATIPKPARQKIDAAIAKARGET